MTQPTVSCHFFTCLAKAATFFVCMTCAAADVAAADRLPDRIQFNRDIRPILSDHCFACHGPDQNSREADLRFDTEAGLFGAEGEAGPVKRGELTESSLFHRITASDEAERMPPSEFGKDLNSEQIELLKRWIEQGAAWEGHWSFQPIQRPEVPTPPAALPQMASPIDTFVASTLEQQQLSFAATADRRTLARRLYFDLLGLPPAPEVVERFEQATDPMAYEQLVDELLASPHFGERMAMWWLDLVRYADSVGYHGDQPVSVSPFRDYVIDSFNDNKPFNQFTIEQLAGDLLPDATLEQKIAAGYNRLGMMSAEGGVQPKEYLAKYIAERVRNLGGTWLGVTLGCCECHDHKYDPFSAADFYRFEAFFADIEERGLYGGDDWGPQVKVPSPDEQRKLVLLDAKLAELRQTLERPSPELATAQAAWEQARSNWQTLRPSAFESSGGATLTLLPDGSLLASGSSPATDITTLTFAEWPSDITAVRIEALPDASLPNQGPGRAGNGNFVLSEIEVRQLEAGQTKPRSLQNATATYEQTGAAEGHPDKKWTAASAIDGDTRGATWGWAIMEQAGRVNSAVFEFQPVSESSAESAEAAGVDNESTPSQLQIVLKQQLDNPQHTLGRFRILVTSAPLPIRAEHLLPADVETNLRTPLAERTAEQQEALAKYYRSLAPELNPIRETLKQIEAERQELDKQIPTMLVTKTVEPRMVRVLARGNWMDESGTTVRPAIPELLGGQAVAEEVRLNRLDLAKWVVAQENPLTARVTVNRLWKLLFGGGLSGKLDDLGAQGEWPSHPELLDWLADEFRMSGWNIKHILKLMVMSETYRQSSLVSTGLSEQDPYNRLLARQGRWRLDAELVRDTLLSFSGLLVDEIGGESVKPYQPAGYWAYLNFPQREWQSGQGTELYRRGVYTHWQRQYLHPSLLAFDAPSREECTADRSRSNTPLQALVLLNDPTYVEAARAFAMRIVESGETTDETRLAWAIRTALNRAPRDGELAILLDLLSRHRVDFQSRPDDARLLLEVGKTAAPVALDSDASALAAWISVARALMNLHETITRN